MAARVNGRPVYTLLGTLSEPFATIAELQQALTAFKRRYNQEWLIERHGVQTPAQLRASLATPHEQAA